MGDWTQLYNCNYKELLSKIDNQSIDLIIADPPYNISQDNNFSTMKNATRQGLDFGEWDYEFDQSQWIKDVAPLLVKGGSIIIFNRFANLGDICKTLEGEGLVIKDLLRWVKNNPMPKNMDRRYVSDYEFAIWATKNGDKWTFNNESGTYLRPEFRYPLVSTKDRIHPTQKSLELIKDIIKIHSNKGGFVLDPFFGSCVVGAACIELERYFIGSEINKEYFELALERIKKLEEQKGGD